MIEETQEAAWSRVKELIENLQLANDADFVMNVLKLDNDSALTFSEFRDFLNREMLIRILEAVRSKSVRAPRLTGAMTVPPDIMDAAQKVAIWAETQGWRDWVIGPVADRKLTGL